MRKILFLIVVFIIGCSREKTLSGSIFIVTKDGVSIKLGLVEVGLIDSIQTQNYVNKSAAYVKANSYRMAKIVDSLVSEKNRLDTLESLYLDSAHKYLMDKKRYSKYNSKWIETIKLGSGILLNFAFARDTLNNLVDGGAYFQQLPPFFKTVKSDADGKFIFLVPAGTYMAVASTSRDVGESVEKYYWITWVRVKANPTNMTLSNDNLVATRCVDCVFK